MFQSQKIVAIWEVVVFVGIYEVMFEHFNSIKEFSEITLGGISCRPVSELWHRLKTLRNEFGILEKLKEG